MRILLSGASGFIGAPLSSLLESRGHIVVPLERFLLENHEQLIPCRELDGFDAVIHLAGEPIASGLWTKRKRQKILESRSLNTQFLCRSLEQLSVMPKVFISASAVGYYGDRGEERLDETSSSGGNFLSLVCREWERASLSLQSRGVRVVHLRFGSVLGPHGGILGKMLSLYRLGLGAQLGSGQQWMSWIALKDLMSVVASSLDQKWEGAINVVSPHPVRQIIFSKLLAQLLHRPHFLTVPSFALRLALGSFADEILLPSARVYPDKLLKASFDFRYPLLEEALKAALS